MAPSLAIYGASLCRRTTYLWPVFKLWPMSIQDYPSRHGLRNKTCDKPQCFITCPKQHLNHVKSSVMFDHIQYKLWSFMTPKIRWSSNLSQKYWNCRFSSNAEITTHIAAEKKRAWADAPDRATVVTVPRIRLISRIHHPLFCIIHTMWGPPVISWFISPSNYSYKCHKP